MSVEGVVEEVKTLQSVFDKPTNIIWFSIKIDGREYALHNNWMAVNGELKVGDKVKFELSTLKFMEKQTFKTLRRVDVGGSKEEDIVRLVESGT